MNSAGDDAGGRYGAVTRCSSASNETAHRRRNAGWLLGRGRHHFLFSTATEAEQCLDGGLASGQHGPQLAPTLIARTANDLECDGLTGQVRDAAIHKNPSP